MDVSRCPWNFQGVCALQRSLWARSVRLFACWLGNNAQLPIHCTSMNSTCKCAFQLVARSSSPAWVSFVPCTPAAEAQAKETAICDAQILPGWGATSRPAAILETRI